jgi:D-arabinose 1-dehydrogenase-like Zn-dependent alcohol dehydrogenase
MWADLHADVCVWLWVLGPQNINLNGTTMGSADDMAAMMTLVNRTQLRPVIDSVRPLDEVVAALERMRRGDQCGKLVLTMGPAAETAGARGPPAAAVARL